MARGSIHFYYTLVQHTGFTVGGNPQFKTAVEERMVEPKQAGAIAKAGGLLFNTYSDAHDKVHAINYPEGYTGLIPVARGTFKTVKGFPEPLFVPGDKGS